MSGVVATWRGKKQQPGKRRSAGGRHTTPTHPSQQGEKVGTRRANGVRRQRGGVGTCERPHHR